MSELNIVQAPEASPTQCVRCSSVKGPFLDVGVEVLGYGRIYLCIGDDESPGCLPQAARHAGWADPSLRAALEAKVRGLQIENSALTAKVGPLTAAFDAFDHFKQAESDRVEALGEPSPALKPVPKTKAKA